MFLIHKLHNKKKQHKTKKLKKKQNKSQKKNNNTNKIKIYKKNTYNHNLSLLLYLLPYILIFNSILTIQYKSIYFYHITNST